MVRNTWSSFFFYKICLVTVYKLSRLSVCQKKHSILHLRDEGQEDIFCLWSHFCRWLMKRKDIDRKLIISIGLERRKVWSIHFLRSIKILLLTYIHSLSRSLLVNIVERRSGYPDGEIFVMYFFFRSGLSSQFDISWRKKLMSSSVKDDMFHFLSLSPLGFVDVRFMSMIVIRHLAWRQD